jgi:hypothetical protein
MMHMDNEPFPTAIDMYACLHQGSRISFFFAFYIYIVVRVFFLYCSVVEDPRQQNIKRYVDLDAPVSDDVVDYRGVINQPEE